MRVWIVKAVWLSLYEILGAKLRGWKIVVVNCEYSNNGNLDDNEMSAYLEYPTGRVLMAYSAKYIRSSRI
jgi:hypothetical protein